MVTVLKGTGRGGRVCLFLFRGIVAAMEVSLRVDGDWGNGLSLSEGHIIGPRLYGGRRRGELREVRWYACTGAYYGYALLSPEGKA